MNKVIKKNKVKIGWILLGDNNVASSRIHGLNIHKFLLGKKGINSKIIQYSSIMCNKLRIPLWKQCLLLFSGYNIFIFQKVYDDNSIKFAKMAKRRGIKIIFLQSDLIETEMIDISDYVVVVSDYLQYFCRQKYGINAIVIEDAIEVSQSLFKQHIGKDELEIVWVGHKDNWHTLEIVYKAFEKIKDENFSLKTISNHHNATVKWDIKTFSEEILKSDIAVIPSFNTNWSNAKSSNRLIMFMSLGLPVIASPVPSYQKIIRNGENGFIAEGVDDWARYLIFMKDVNVRKKIGETARKTVVEKYSIERIGSQWISLLRNIVSPTNRDITSEKSPK